MFCSVKWPSTSWNPPTIRNSVGRIRNIRAKTKNGETPIQDVAAEFGLGKRTGIELSDYSGNIPTPSGRKKLHEENPKAFPYGDWFSGDNAQLSIGQTEVLVSPLQLAIMTSRIASGRNLTPSLMFGQLKPPGPPLPFTPEQLAVTHDGMFRVVNGSGTGAGSRLQVGNITMSGKTGTAQVARLISRGGGSAWKARDHSWFICYAPSDAPRYAMATVVEHGGFGASAAAPIAKDVMTCLFDPAKAWADLLAMEKTWGGTPAERMAAKYRAYAAQYGASAPKAASDAAVEAAMAKPETTEPPVETTGVITDAERGEANAAPTDASKAPAEPVPSTGSPQ